jgi:hypothetical protein
VVSCNIVPLVTAELNDYAKYVVVVGDIYDLLLTNAGPEAIVYRCDFGNGHSQAH